MLLLLLPLLVTCVSAGFTTNGGTLQMNGGSLDVTGGLVVDSLDGARVTSLVGVRSAAVRVGASTPSNIVFAKTAAGSSNVITITAERSSSIYRPGHFKHYCSATDNTRTAGARGARIDFRNFFTYSDGPNYFRPVVTLVSVETAPDVTTGYTAGSPYDTYTFNCSLASATSIVSRIEFAYYTGEIVSAS